MSLYDDAAVALIAEGAAGKDGVLYNIKPEEKLKATELITNGGFIDGSGWEDSTPASGVITFSDGKAVFAELNDYHYLRTSTAVFEKDKTYKVSFTITDFTMVGTGNPQLLVQESNNQSPTITSIKASGQYSFIYKAKGKENNGAQVGTPSKLVFKNSGSDSSNKVSFKLDNVSVKEVEQAPKDFTFTRGSNLTATRVGPDGKIEKGRENLIKYSNTLDGTGWANTTGSPVNYNAAVGGQSGYDGSTNAWLIDKITATNSYIGGPYFGYDGVYTWSMYARNEGTDDNGLHMYTPYADAYFNLLNGQIISQGGSNKVEVKMVPVTGSSGDTDRWYRCSVTGVGEIVNNDQEDRPRFKVINTDGSNGGDGAYSSTGKIFVQNFQFEAGLVATDYIESHIATGEAGIFEDSPRFDYTDVTCPHLLMEPTRKNLFQYSEYLGGDFGTIRSTFNYNDSKSPEGLDNAVSIKETVVSPDNTHGFQHLDLSITDGTFYSFSFFVKADGRERFFCQFSDTDTLKMNVDVNLSGTPSASDGRPGHTGSEEIIDYGNGWYRVEINGKEGLATDATGNLNFFFIEDASGTDTSYAGDTTKGLLFYGLQIEEGHFCTSYIPNHGKSGGETRNYDTTDSLDFGDYMDGDDVTLFVDLAKNPQLIRDGGAGEIRLSSSNKTAGSIKLYRSGNTNLRTVIYFADLELDNDPSSHIVTDGTSPNIAIRRVKSTGEFTVFYDGAQQYQAFNTNYDVLDNILIRGDDQPIFINSILLFDRALTDDECKALAT